NHCGKSPKYSRLAKTRYPRHWYASTKRRECAVAPSRMDRREPSTHSLLRRLHANLRATPHAVEVHELLVQSLQESALAGIPEFQVTVLARLIQILCGFPQLFRVFLFDDL